MAPFCPMWLWPGNRSMTGYGESASNSVEFACGQPAQCASKLDRRALQAEADAEERDPPLANVADRADHPLDSAGAETAGHEQPVDSVERALRPVFLQVLRLDPADLHANVVGHTGVREGLDDALVGVLIVRVLAADRDGHAPGRLPNRADHLLPRAQIERLRGGQSETLLDQPIEPAPVEVERNGVDRRHVGGLDHCVGRDAAEQRDLLAHLEGDRHFRAA